MGAQEKQQQKQQQKQPQSQSQEKSIRKTAAPKKKAFKHVLNTPYQVKWPTPPEELVASLFEELLRILAPVGEHRLAKSKKDQKDDSESPAPEVTERIHVGINATTRYLDQRINNEKDASAQSAIFVCKRDIRPNHVCAHLPTMAGICQIRLIPLPEGSEQKLAAALGLPRVCSLAMEITEENLWLDVREIPVMKAPVFTGESSTFFPTQIKTVGKLG
ncbi:hypothetical protein BCR43DRAFT_484141 [Syncephalastrum racemosum]|uniref:Uncharacterized protein n=1 Tax=Syncephalastrum racemosum TaxID=13706 RepID=A0A1X2HWA9_SYNRA|nr:hypothetical protein BCR43DRAFT_484141 [Syncephalastrum racemosum]